LPEVLTGVEKDQKDDHHPGADLERRIVHLPPRVLRRETHRDYDAGNREPEKQRAAADCARYERCLT